jgi:2-oxoglutarate dehydrogenase E2 component (dihydrolipoamide succinyltransferase)
MKIEIKVPEIGESISEVTMGTWIKESGTFVDEDEIICEIESEKATVEITAEQAGILHQKAQEGDTLAVGAVLAEIDLEGQKPAEKVKKEKQTTEEKATEQLSETAADTKITPVAAKILEEAGIDSTELKGSGSGGRITKTDAMEFVSQGIKTKQVKYETQDLKSTEKIPSAERISADSDRSEKRVRMTTLRKTIAERLLASKHGTAMLTTINEIDLSEIKKIRAHYKEQFKEKHNVGLGFMSFFTKAVCTALQEYPIVNAKIDDNEIVYHNYCDISIAVSTDRGLVVPVIRNAERMSLAEIELVVADLAEKARNNKLTIDEMTGGTFSITNGGVFGSLISTPIINTPQSAILGMHTIQDRPVARNGEIVIRPMMYVALSYDHRIIDGKESVTFLVRVKELLEDPIRLLVDV